MDRRFKTLAPFLPGAALVLIETGLQLSGVQNVPLAVALWSLAAVLLLAAAVHHGRNWHNGQREAGMAGLSSFYFIIPCLVVGVAAIAVAAYGFGLRETVAATSEPQSDRQPIDIFTGNKIAEPQNPYPQSILTSRYYSKQNKEEVADILDAVTRAFNNQTRDLFTMAEVAINQSPWDRPGEDVAPMIERLERIEAVTQDFRRDLFEVLYKKHPDYREELNKLLFPIEASANFQGGAKNFANALVVWNKHRGALEGSDRQEFVALVNTARGAFAGFRQEFLKWESERETKITQTRLALKQ